jgi:hypothetical protein
LVIGNEEEPSANKIQIFLLFSLSLHQKPPETLSLQSDNRNNDLRSQKHPKEFNNTKSSDTVGHHF